MTDHDTRVYHYQILGFLNENATQLDNHIEHRWRLMKKFVRGSSGQYD